VASGAVDCADIARPVSRRRPPLGQYAGSVERQPEPWEHTAAAGPCATIDGPSGPVELWVLGDQRYRVKAPNGEQVVEGFQRAREVARELAER
jgi:hypothetical protein